MKIPIAACAALCLLACGGSQKTEEPNGSAADDAAGEEQAMSEEQILAAHQARQFEACEVMCDQLTECVLEDTWENAPEALEGIDVDAFAAHYKETRCLTPCQTSELSVRQVETMEGCNEAGGTCEEFLACLDAVQPQPEQPS
jgi:hypothetical protein